MIPGPVMKARVAVTSPFKGLVLINMFLY